MGEWGGGLERGKMKFWKQRENIKTREKFKKDLEGSENPSFFFFHFFFRLSLCKSNLYVFN